MSTKKYKKAELPAGIAPTAAIDIESVRTTIHALNIANEDLQTLQTAFSKLAVSVHIMKIGGTATHSGSFEHCNSKLCKENRAVLGSIKTSPAPPLTQ